MHCISHLSFLDRAAGWGAWPSYRLMRNVTRRYPQICRFSVGLLCVTIFAFMIVLHKEQKRRDHLSLQMRKKRQSQALQQTSQAGAGQHSLCPSILEGPELLPHRQRLILKLQGGPPALQVWLLAPECLRQQLGSQRACMYSEMLPCSNSSFLCGIRVTVSREESKDERVSAVG